MSRQHFSQRWHPRLDGVREALDEGAETQNSAVERSHGFGVLWVLSGWQARPSQSDEAILRRLQSQSIPKEDERIYLEGNYTLAL